LRTKTKRAPGTGQSRLRRFKLALITISLSTIVSLGVCEILFRILEYRENAHIIQEGPGNRTLPDARWGWKPSTGSFHSATAEFDVTGNVNSLWMNDSDYDPLAEDKLVRILALGDSHTFAVGVSSNQTWPKLLESKLNAIGATRSYRVYNAGVSGYSMHQYLLRLMDQGPLLHPDYVVLGISYATDLYDLLPPDRGGWVYGGDGARDYFDFDQNGNLTQRHWDPRDATVGSTRTAQTVRDILEYSAAFRYLRRSRLSLFIGSHVKVNGQTLWPNMDIVLEKDVAPAHDYQWRLFDALLKRTKEECDRQGAKLIVVGIPYLPQVYDEVWNSTFGNNPGYSRTAAIERVQAECQALGIAYVDTLEPLRTRSKEVRRWLHYHKDAHPTAEGQDVIAETVFHTGILKNTSTARLNY